MAYKALIFGTDNIYPKLKPFYDAEVKCGNLEIVAIAELKNDNVNIVYADGRRGGDYGVPNFDIAIVSSRRDFYRLMKRLETSGIPLNKIIDGRVFQIQNLDFPRLLKEGIAYGIVDENILEDDSRTIYPKVYKTRNGMIKLVVGIKSYIRYNCRLEVQGLISLGNFCNFACNIYFSVGENYWHNYSNVSINTLSNLDWYVPENFLSSQGTCKILIGNDVWCGRSSTFKCTNPNKPLIIGDGAIIASDSVVVKNVPPYAIVGGNPAQIIKYRFPPHVIEALLRIKWWDWSLDKIHDNFKYFNDVEKFISLHDK